MFFQCPLTGNSHQCIMWYWYSTITTIDCGPSVDNLRCIWRASLVLGPRDWELGPSNTKLRLYLANSNKSFGPLTLRLLVMYSMVNMEIGTYGYSRTLLFGLDFRNLELWLKDFYIGDIRNSGPHEYSDTDIGVRIMSFGRFHYCPKPSLRSLEPF